MPNPNIVFSLLNLIAAAEGRSPLVELEPDLRRILVFIANEIDRGQHLCITDILSHGDFGVAVTASKRLRELESRGWVAIYQDPTNHRRRLIGLTPRARSSFGMLAREVSEALPDLLPASASKQRH